MRVTHNKLIIYRRLNMIINMKEQMKAFALENTMSEDFHFSDVNIDTDLIKVIMINEVVPLNPEDDFYGNNTIPDYLTTTLPLFERAGYHVDSIHDIVKAGIYITNAIKIPKEDTTVSREMIENCVPLLEYELGLFPNLKVIMLMGDVSKKAFNMITKKKTKKNVIPAISTYKLRNDKIYYEDIRVFPSYIMTGGNILIEKSKAEMIVDDIKQMMKIIK
jgi:uracil-DNA glycosylase